MRVRFSLLIHSIFVASRVKACVSLASSNQLPQLQLHDSQHYSHHSNNTTHTAMPGPFDVLIIGGGPAGLATATALARQLYTAVVFDSGAYRNARARHMHNVPTWDHRDPADFRAAARRDLLARYATVQFREAAVESVRVRGSGDDDGRKLFEATDAAGRVWTGRKLVLASGVRDVYPDIPGYDDVWGRGV